MLTIKLKQVVSSTVTSPNFVGILNQDGYEKSVFGYLIFPEKEDYNVSFVELYESKYPVKDLNDNKGIDNLFQEKARLPFYMGVFNEERMNDKFILSVSGKTIINAELDSEGFKVFTVADENLEDSK